MEIRNNMQNLGFGTLSVKLPIQDISDKTELVTLIKETEKNDTFSTQAVNAKDGLVAQIIGNSPAAENQLAEKLKKFGAEVVYTITGNGEEKTVQKKMADSLGGLLSKNELL